MFTFHSMVLIVHVLISASIVGLVLLQRGKGADAGAAFGSGASGTVFGARGSANFLTRTTAVLATAFFLSSLGLAFLGSQQAPPAIDELAERLRPLLSSILRDALRRRFPQADILDEQIPGADLPAINGAN